MENSNLQYVGYFDDLNLKSGLLRGIYSHGYEKPSEIQRKAILPILQGFDVIAQAQQGTGRTASLIIPVLQLVEEDLQEAQAIILVSTQDLAQAISHLIKCLAEFLKVSICVCDKSASEESIEGMQILIGTPEIISQMLKTEPMKMNALKVLAVDEADKLSSQEGMREILGSLDDNVQVVIFSTTMAEDILAITKKYKRNPVVIILKKEELRLERIRHFYILVDEKEMKNEVLIELFEGLGTTPTLIYCNNAESANEVAETLSKKDLKYSKIHEMMEFPDQEAALKKFRIGESHLHVTTNKLSREIDIQRVYTVLNYDFPLTKEEYGERIGKCNRFKREYAISFVTPNEAKELRELEKYYGIIFDCFTDYFF